MTCEYSERKALNFLKSKKNILGQVLSNGHFSPPLLEIESLLKIFLRYAAFGTHRSRKIEGPSAFKLVLYKG